VMCPKLLYWLRMVFDLLGINFQVDFELLVKVDMVLKSIMWFQITIPSVNNISNTSHSSGEWNVVCIPQKKKPGF